MYAKNNRQGFNERAPPVNVGDELDVQVDAVGEKGDGLAKKDGFVLIIPGAKVNDCVRIRITRVLTKVGFAEVIGKSEKPIFDKNRSGKNNFREAKPKREEFKYDESKDSEDFGEETNKDSDVVKDNNKDESDVVEDEDKTESEAVDDNKDIGVVENDKDSDVVENDKENTSINPKDKSE